MLGIRKVNTTYLTHKEFWIDCLIGSIGSLIDFAGQMVSVLTFGRLTTDWGTCYFNLTFREKVV